MSSLKKKEGLGLVEFLVASTVVAGSIAIFLQRSMQMDRQRRVDEILHYKSMIRNNVRGLLGDGDICKLALHPAVGGNPPYISLGSFTLQQGSIVGPLEVTDVSLPAVSGTPNLYRLTWTLRQRSGLANARSLQDSVDIVATFSPGPTVDTCGLAGASTDPWLEDKPQICAFWNRPDLPVSTPPTAADLDAMADCSFSSFLPADFGGVHPPTRSSLTSAGARITRGDNAAALRAAALGKLATTAPATLCLPGEAMTRIRKNPTTQEIELQCSAIPPLGASCTTPCASDTCCRPNGAMAELYSGGDFVQALPGACATNFPSALACSATAQMGSGPGCTAPSFFCAAGPCTTPCSGAGACCRNNGPLAERWIDGQFSNSAAGPCASSIFAADPICSAAQTGIGAGCSSPTFHCPPAPTCNAPSPCLSCCMNQAGGMHRTSIGGVLSSALPGTCGATNPAMSICGSPQWGTGAGCTSPTFYCGTPTCNSNIPPLCFDCLRSCHELSTSTGATLQCYGGVGPPDNIWTCTQAGSSGIYPWPGPVSLQAAPQVTGAAWNNAFCFYSAVGPHVPGIPTAATSRACVSKTQSQLGVSGYCQPSYFCRGP